MLVGVLGATTALPALLGVTDPVPDPGHHSRFLIINLVLAWLPLLLALGVSRARHRWAAAAFGLVWLAFLPNAPYLVTDLIHLSGWYGQRWRHVLMFGFAAWTGVMLGVASLGEWVGAPAENARATAVAVAVALFFGLAYLTVWAFDGLSPAGPSGDTGRN